MASIRPEILAFMQAVEALITHSKGEPLSDEEADELSRYLGRLEDTLHLE